ncbi:branched-chain amino acid ABC transporter [Desulfocucumis palustris]|uniref:Branched-chain amino acid ABC transporter n=1 Tax=Desulfocucumis palustris TaxID=1898651 RepID=A0A2L2XDX8_9FIRM|nr:ABC transporter substrate-binding protein [Desulfocucumis palustris]GBF32031.1 branched-chain amino acid ABC transporter [Desulfocucumis palustris]
MEIYILKSREEKNLFGFASKRFILPVVLTLALLLLAGCGGGAKDGEQGGQEKEVYKIGAIFDITGPSSSLGVPERDSALLLEEQINARGGINGHPVKIVIGDNESNETKAVQVAKKLIEVDKVLAIAGPSTTGTSMAIVDTAQKNQVPLVSAAAGVSIVNPVDKRQWVFKTAQNDSVVVEKIIEYLGSIGAKKVAFLCMNNAYGDSGRQEFTTAAQKAGIEIAADEKFGATDNDMTAQLTKVKAARPDAVIVWAIPPSASIVTKNYRQLQIDAPLIHSHGIGNKTFVDLAQDAANGVIFPAGRLLVAESLPDSDPQKAVLVKYAADYENKYNQPRSTFGGHGADAVSLIVSALEKAGPDRAKIRDELEKTQNYPGISGVFNMSPQDHSGLTKDALVMLKIVDGKWTILE